VLRSAYRDDEPHAVNDILRAAGGDLQDDLRQAIDWHLQALGHTGVFGTGLGTLSKTKAIRNAAWRPEIVLAETG
jgi:hypothetical protein